LRHYRRSADDTPTTLCYCAVGHDHYVWELGELRSPEAGVVDLVPPTSPFGDVIEGVGTDADADRLIAEARKRVAAIDKWIATWWYPGEEERKKEVNERELDTREVDARVAEELRLRRVDAETRRRLALVEEYGEDTYADGTVFRFTKHHYRDGVYTYAILKVGGMWYRTGRDCPNVGQRLTWDELVRWLAGGVDPVWFERLERLWSAAEAREFLARSASSRKSLDVSDVDGVDDISDES
jgi:hypothetical protein